MVFKFGFDEGEASDCDGQSRRDVGDGPGLCAWIVPLPGISEVSQDEKVKAASEIEEHTSPDVFDVVEVAQGAVRLRKTVVSASQAGLAPESSDLIAGKYEGGYKLWECACDLIRFMHDSVYAKLAGSSVLELGAGHALPALYAVQSGAAVVDVADFNEDVLLGATAPNIRLNCDDKTSKEIRMVAGDWAGIPDALGGATYDIVLAAEVVYAVEGLGRLSKCIIDVLKPDGVALVAGKTYYFGVGGGMRAFEKAMLTTAEAMSVHVEMEVVDEVRDGKSNVREIVRVRKVGAVGCDQ